MRTLTIVLLLLSSPSIAWSQPAAERFVGTWLLDRIETRSDSGEWTRAETRLGADPIGAITYDASGHMAVQIMRRDRPRLSRPAAGARALSEDDLMQVPVDEKALAFDGYTAYFGRYSVREREGIVVHDRIGHLVPNRSGSRVERRFDFVDDTLVLSVAGTNRLVWKRAR